MSLHPAGSGPRVVDPDSLATVLDALGGDNPRIVVSGNYATPRTLMSVVDRAVPRYRLFILAAQKGIPVREGIVHETAFVGPGMRDLPTLKYVPSRLSLVPVLLKTTRCPDIVLVHTSTPREGRLSLGTEVNILPAAIEAARGRGAVVIAQMNPQMPYTFGHSEVSLAVFDYLVEVDEDLREHVQPPADSVSAEIGRRVAALVPDGATLQMGIGGVPDATLAELTRHRGLRTWTEMFSDGVLALDAAGALDPDATLHPSFLFGSGELYTWVDRNPRVRMVRTEVSNDPANIAQQPRMTSINTALQVDLFGQANASRVGNRVYSGFGGQTDFIVGALHAPGGQAIIALPSWHPRADVSTVVPMLQTPATSFQHSWIVSEQGAAKIWGSSADEQAYQLIENVAHPRGRAARGAAAKAMGLA